MDLQDGLVVFVRNEELRGEGVPLLDHVAHRVAGGGLDLQLRGGFGRAAGYQGIRSQTTQPCGCLIKKEHCMPFKSYFSFD